MNDVLEQLRAANPVPEAPAPSVEEVWRKLEAGDRPRESGDGRVPGARARHRRRSTWLIPGLAMIPVVAVAALAALVLRGGGAKGPAPVAVPAGPVLVHYIATSTTRAYGAGTTQKLVWDVWTTGARSHVYVYRDGVLLAEIATDRRRVRWYSGRRRGHFLATGIVARGRPVCNASLTMCGWLAPDPLALVRALPRSGAVAQGRLGRFGVRVLFDPDPSIRLEVITREPASGRAIVVTTTIFSGYARLPFRASDAKLLELSAHPGVPAQCRVLEPDNLAGNCPHD